MTHTRDWSVVTRSENLPFQRGSYIGVSRSGLNFGVVFCRLAGLAAGSLVVILVDTEKKRVGIQIPGARWTKDSRTVCTNGSKSKTSLHVEVHALRKYDWISAVHKLRPPQRRFTPVLEGDTWVLDLGPALVMAEAPAAPPSAPAPSLKAKGAAKGKPAPKAKAKRVLAPKRSRTRGSKTSVGRREPGEA